MIEKGKIHYLKTEKTRISPCGKVNQEINFFSTTWRFVTCKNCLKKARGDEDD